jgi:hypothetical protein
MRLEIQAKALGPTGNQQSLNTGDIDQSSS